MAAGGKTGVKVLTTVMAIPLGIASRKLVTRVWHVARPEDPAREAATTDRKWGDVIGYAALSAAGLVVADLLARRSAEVTYEAITGNSAAPTAKPNRTAKRERKARRSAG